MRFSENTCRVHPTHMRPMSQMHIIFEKIASADMLLLASYWHGLASNSTVLRTEVRALFFAVKICFQALLCCDICKNMLGHRLEFGLEALVRKR